MADKPKPSNARKKRAALVKQLKQQQAKGIAPTPAMELEILNTLSDKDMERIMAGQDPDESMWGKVKGFAKSMFGGRSKRATKEETTQPSQESVQEPEGFEEPESQAMSPFSVADDDSPEFFSVPTQQRRTSFVLRNKSQPKASDRFRRNSDPNAKVNVRFADLGPDPFSGQASGVAGGSEVGGFGGNGQNVTNDDLMRKLEEIPRETVEELTTTTPE